LPRSLIKGKLAFAAEELDNYPIDLSISGMGKSLSNLLTISKLTKSEALTEQN
jgi:hypothetical protein